MQVRMYASAYECLSRRSVYVYRVCIHACMCVCVCVYVRCTVNNATSAIGKREIREFNAVNSRSSPKTDLNVQIHDRQCNNVDRLVRKLKKHSLRQEHRHLKMGKYANVIACDC
jgi:hypothetical protein